MDHNPYESPQTISFAVPRGDDLARDTYDVLRGARILLIATFLGLGLVLLELSIAFLEIEHLWGWTSWLLTIDPWHA